MRSNVNKSDLEDLVATIEKAKEEIELCEFLHADSSDAQKQLSALLAEMKENFGSAYEKAEGIYEIAHDTLDRHVKDTLSSFKASIEKTKNEGCNTRSAERLMSEAQNAYTRGDYKSALSLGMKSEGELEKVSLQKEMAEKAIRTAGAKIEEASKLGISAMEAEDYLNSAKEDIEKGQYVTALEYAVKSGDVLHKVKETFSEAEDVITQLRSSIKTAVELGADATSIEKIMTDTENAKKLHHYEHAIDIGRDGIVTARNISHAYLDQRRKEILGSMDLINDVAYVGDLIPLLDEAKTFMDYGKFTISNEKMNRCMELINQRLGNGGIEGVLEVEKAVGLARKMIFDWDPNNKKYAGVIQLLQENTDVPNVAKTLEVLYLKYPELKPAE